MTNHKNRIQPVTKQLLYFPGEAVTDGADDIQATCRTTVVLHCPGCPAALHIVADPDSSVSESTCQLTDCGTTEVHVYTRVASSRAAILSPVA